MSMLRTFALLAAVTFVAGSARAQEPAKPGPEHEMLKKWEGTWDVTMKMEGMEAKGSSTFKMELGGLWLASTMDCELFGTKFTGKGMDTYDAKKKKYIGVWCDSMSTTPLILEGTYDERTKKMTMTGESPGPDGKMQKCKTVTEFKDEDTAIFGMYMGDAKDPMFTVTYKRKK
jgi:hypothetical protein